jgi:anti-anti-sigma regulatory factor
MVVRMAMSVVWLKFDEERVGQALEEAMEKLDGIENEVILDFSSVRRIDLSALKAMEEFVGVADGKGVKIVLRFVSVEIYKVLKLVKLAPRFVFSN